VAEARSGGLRPLADRWIFCLRYVLFWVGVFALARLVFLAYHFPRTRTLDPATLGGILAHGLRMDVAAAAYLCALPVLAVALTAPFGGRPLAGALGAYTALTVVASALLVTVDLEIFGEWGHRLDATVLLYLHTPREMLASAGSSPLPLLLAIMLGLAGAGLALAFRWLLPPVRALRPAGPLGAVLVLPALVPLFFGARGGFGEWSLTQSSVYFSADNFANQAAVNAIWTFGDSVQDGDLDRANPLAVLPMPEAARLVEALHAPAGGPTPRLLTTPRPNVILVIWESFTAKVVERLGGRGGVTPRFDRLVAEGVLFDAFLASGDRSAKGLVALLSGYPAPPVGSMMKTPRKTQRLPLLSRDLRAAGYHTAFYYGGELDFANLRAYIAHGDFHEIVGKHSFEAGDWNSRWGAHDHVTLARLLATLRRVPEPFFHVLFTLSSHEPFEVPGPAAFPGPDKLSRFLSAHHYTDDSLGRFIDQARREPWWDRTLVIITGDHGHPLPPAPGSPYQARLAAYHVPMLWLGGAVAAPGTTVGRLGTQADLARTLLTQLGLEATAYRWSRDLLAPGGEPFAWFSGNGRFGYRTGRGGLDYSVAGRRVIAEGGTVGDDDRRRALAYAQVLYQDFLER
jgi:phosphoglycerol transferase MdoB-like AlkP superfamily enzyme